MRIQKYWNTFCLLFTKIWVVSEREYASMPALFHLDDYDRCMLYGPNALYCSISFQLYPKHSENVSDVWKVIQKVSTAKSHYRHDLLRHGICVNERCPDIPKLELLSNNIQYVQKFSDCYSGQFDRIGLEGKIVAIRCENESPLYPINFYDYIFAIFITTIVASVLLASILDFYNCNEKFRNTTVSTLIYSFSIIRNWRRLTDVHMNNSDARALRSLQGVRFYNVAGVIIAHTFAVNMAVPILNPRYMESLRDRRIDQFWGLGSRFVTMQTFFLVSVWLLTYKFCKETEGKNVTLSYLIRRIFSRYIRLTPLMTITILLAATWMPHIATGPLWNFVIGAEYNLCRKSWWSNLMYISNFFPFHETCASHLWHLAIDMQFYILALVLLWFMKRQPKQTFVILAGVWMLHLVDIFMKTLKIEFKEVSPESSYNTTLVNMADNLNLIKATTTNLPAVLAGVVYGHLFYKYRNTKLLTKKSHIVSWWIISITSAVGAPILPGIIINMYHKNYVLYTLYICLSRTVFAFGVGLFILGMTQGQGGIIRKACEWPPIYILGRLTYGAYLIHPLLQRLKVGVLRAPNYLNDYLLIYECLGFIAWSFLLSTPLTLFFEMPFELKTNRFEATKKTQKNCKRTE